MRKWTWLALVPAAALAVGFASGSGNRSGPLIIQGNYILDYRETPDGKQLRAPEVIGMMSVTGDRRNMNVYWKDQGKQNSVSVIAHYTLSDTQYSEDNVFYCMNDAAGGKGISYDTAPTRGSSNVTIDGYKIKFSMPLHGEPDVVFDQSGLTATKKGGFVDHWKKVN